MKKPFKPKLSKNSRYKNGTVQASKLPKFVPTETSPHFAYRSSYEYSFMLYCEKNGNVKNWSSEPFTIEYPCLVKKKIRNYWIDFTMVMFNGEKILVEVKPEKDLQAVKLFQLGYSRLQTSEAKRAYIMTNQTAANNMSKWQAATLWCKQRNMLFQVVTEKFLKR